MASTVILKASGLQTSPNELNRQEGALVEASNVIIRRDNIIEQRRGIKLYGTELENTSNRVKQLTTYRNRLIRHYANRLAFDSDAKGTFLEFSGSFFETQAGLRMKFVESNGNFYFTSSEGIKKISAKTSDDFTTADGSIQNSGAVKAVDLTGKIIYRPNAQSTWFPQDSAVAYRVIWAYNDINGNLILGAPSQRMVISNPMTSLLIRDYTQLLVAMDNLQNTPLTSARINDANFVETLGLTLNSSPSDLYLNLQALTVKFDQSILFADQGAVSPLQITSAAITSGICTVTVTGTVADYITPGSKVYLTGFTPAVGTIPNEISVVSTTANTISFNTTATGAVTLSSATIISNEFRTIPKPTAPSIPVTNDQLVGLQSYYEKILDALSETPNSVVSSTDKVTLNALDVTTTVTTELSITIPEGIDDRYFYQVYRSSVSQATGAASFDDIVPSDELQLVYEAFPVVEQIEAGVVVIEDITPDAFRGANLYTNASTGEGILQANDPPPFAKDINRYRNSVFYANSRTRQNAQLSMLGVTQMITDYDNGIIPKITISNGRVTNTYKFITGQQEITTIVTVADVANSLNGKYFFLNSVDTAYCVFLDTGTAIPPSIPGKTNIKIGIPTNSSAADVAKKIRTVLSTYLDSFIVTNISNTIEVINYKVGIAEDSTAATSGFTITKTQDGRSERVQPEITKVTVVPGNQYVTAGPSDYFTLNTAGDTVRLYVWFKVAASVDPLIPYKRGIKVEVDLVDTTTVVINKIIAALPTELFKTKKDLTDLLIQNIKFGEATASTEVVANPAFIVTRKQEGALEVLLSPLVSPARAVDETARSFIRVMNKNPGEIIYGYYLSSAFDVPGKMYLEARSLQQADQFFIVANDDAVGTSFNPDIGPEGFITSIGTGQFPNITASSKHGLSVGDKVVMTATNSIPNVDGLFEVIGVVDAFTFTIERGIDIPGTEGSFIRASNAMFSENQEKSNRIYYSKFQQPEAVPISNYFDVGAQDKAILRIAPLRDSLFVFKEDGLYRISGESAPFQLELFDSSFILLAPDSVAIVNNVIYAWTTQGIQSLSEGGSSIISRAIDNIILRIQSDNFKGFETATWGVGYESDNSYLVYTVKEESDTSAQIAYRYSTITDSWTTFDLTHISGCINPANDKLYLSASDVAYIEEERKTFSRLDYTDRELSSVISVGKLTDNSVLLPSVQGIEIGDVVLQTQTITTFAWNSLLEKLDYDSDVNDSDYTLQLSMKSGDSPILFLGRLAQKLDNDTKISFNNFENTVSSKLGQITDIKAGTKTIITAPSHGLITGRVVLIDSSDSSPAINGKHVVTVINANSFSIDVSTKTNGVFGNYQTVGTDFNDQKACFNFIIEKLNTDDGVTFVNYSKITDSTTYEAIITDINQVTKKITLNLTLQFLTGDVTIFKAFESSFTYSPITMGDPLGLKHLREATMMFETRGFTGGVLSFMTDLLPDYQHVPFKLSGNGIFGHTPNFGDGFFGGIGNAAPFRTYIPRQCQRCRFMIIRFSHKVAREDYRVNGATVTGEIGQSTRAYR